MSRMLGAVPVLADSIVEQLCKASDKASDSNQHLGAETEEDAAALSAAVWHSIWPVERCVCLSCHHRISAHCIAAVVIWMLSWSSDESVVRLVWQVRPARPSMGNIQSDSKRSFLLLCAGFVSAHSSPLAWMCC